MHFRQRPVRALPIWQPAPDGPALNRRKTTSLGAGTPDARHASLLTQPARAGFRFSWVDIPVLIASAMGAKLLWDWPTNPGLLVLLVVGHFFLFCNVVRLRRAFELLWAGCFVAITMTLLWMGTTDWMVALVAITPVTAVLVASEVSSGNYRGVGWQLVRHD